jgi:hypothetical protein
MTFYIINTYNNIKRSFTICYFIIYLPQEPQPGLAYWIRPTIGDLREPLTLGITGFDCAFTAAK